jgi:tetratricopeptide (TPR) repeat protein
MKKIITAGLLSVLVLVSCVSVNPPVKDAEASYHYGRKLLDEGDIANAIVEFQKARDSYVEAGYTFSAFSVHADLARAYYMNGEVDLAIETYFNALNYALEQGEGKILLEDLAKVMWDLAGLLQEAGRIEEAKYVLQDLANVYRELEDLDKVMEVLGVLERL